MRIVQVALIQWRLKGFRLDWDLAWDLAHRHRCADALTYTPAGTIENLHAMAIAEDGQPVQPPRPSQHPLPARAMQIPPRVYRPREPEEEEAPPPPAGPMPGNVPKPPPAPPPLEQRRPRRVVPKRQPGQPPVEVTVNWERHPAAAEVVAYISSFHFHVHPPL